MTAVSSTANTESHASVLHENRVFPPSAAYLAQTTLDADTFAQLKREADLDLDAFWSHRARELLTWEKPFTQGLDETQAPFYQWFADGTLNVSFNCLDRHLGTQADKVALIAEADDGSAEYITYQTLYERVCLFANGLKSLGVVAGDRVIIYMPMVANAVVAMQACARLGAIHSVVFGGFSSKSLAERIIDAEAKVVITANVGYRGGKPIELKKTVDEAVAQSNHLVEHVVVWARDQTETVMQARDIWWHDLTAQQTTDCPPVWVSAEHPLFILYTSGSTGKPKGVQHSSAGYLLGALQSFKWTFDQQPNDVFWCTADVGWITGHSYVAYGPLAAGATQVVFEGVPTFPDASRFWQMIEKHKVSIFYTAPTAIRSLIKLGADLPTKHDLSSLRLLGSVGEPINPEAWIWYYNVVGGARCPIVDTWWQTETGSQMLTPLPGAVATKPGSCAFPLPGLSINILDEVLQPTAPREAGTLVIERPFPSMVRTLWRDPERFKTAYFPEEFGGRYVAGDSAMRDEDGYFWILGRTDDVLNVSGHRLGTMEIESALVANPLVAEAAVVGRPDEVTGEAVVAFVTLKGERPTGDAALEMIKTLKAFVGQEIGAIARPADIRFSDALPKTRSGKIMRRLLRSIARGDAITQDISTLENPAIIKQLQEG
ncbi:acetate--CoA ligase [Aquirhabdus sp.]|uniref:acetate--CoA ligase n=1 Tax=Aquirhabdus sp. TaxID=2824160 RepID=UPI00396C70DF